MLKFNKGNTTNSQKRNNLFFEATLQRCNIFEILFSIKMFVKMHYISGFDALILYLFLNEDIDSDFVNLLALLILKKLQKYAPKYWFMKIIKMIILKMCVNFVLNEHVIPNQRTLVFLLCMQKKL